MTKRLTARELRDLDNFEDAAALLAENGAQLYGRDPGVAFQIQGQPNSPHVSIDDERAWQWLSGLLLELRELRKKVKEEAHGSI